jgi:LysR family glycine cleavage system transcriptional activator
MDGLISVLQASKLGSLTAAAEDLGITHGAVSRRIKLVENWLGSSIFERHGRGVRLTADGALIVRRLERLTTGLMVTANDIRARRPQGTVKISVLPSFARLWLVPRLRELEHGDPQLVFRMSTEHSVSQLDGRESDLAVRTGYGDWAGVDAHKLFGERLYPVASAELGARITADGLSLFSYPLLHDSDSGAWRRWARDCGYDYAPRAGERRFADYDLVLAAARAGLGIALARMPLAASSLSEGNLIRLGEPEVEIGRSHWVVTRSGENRPAVLLAAERLLALAASVRA